MHRYQFNKTRVQFFSRFLSLFIILFLILGNIYGQGTLLKVMTYNIHHANPPGAADSTIDLPAVAEVINRTKPDLVALQEVDVNNSRSGVTLNEAKELARLTGMHYYFTKAIEFSGGAYGDAVLSRFAILDSMRYELPVTMELDGETRSVCVIKIQLPDQQKILFASTHLDHLENNDNRLLQAEVLNSIIRSFSLPLIIGGDFNAEPRSPTMNELDKVLNMTCTNYCPYTFPARTPDQTIDYILYTPAAAFEPLRVKTIEETYASDHLPVVVKMRVK